MMFRRSLVVVLALTAAVATFASTAYAEVRQMGGGYVIGSFPTGDWGEIAGFGLALDGTDIIKRDTDKWFSVRSNTALLYNFSRTVDVPSANLGPNDKLSIETKNWSVLFGIGPEFSAPNQNVTPFVFGTVGFDTYWTKSKLEGTAIGAPYSAEHGDSRISFAWGAGGGVRRMIGESYMTELSVEYRSGADHQFLRPEDVNVSGGAVHASRTSHESNQFIIRLGTVFWEGGGNGE